MPTSGKTIWVSVSVSSTILLLGILKHFPNVDEVAHLPSGVSHWKYERFEMYRVNPPLVRLVTALPNWLAGKDGYSWDLFTDAVGRRPEFIIGTARLKSSQLELHEEFIFPRLIGLSFGFIGLTCLTFWVRRVLGAFSAALVCVYWCFSPNILAHAQTIVPDVGSMALGVVACYCFWRYALAPTMESAATAGGCLGLALLTKLTWITAVITLPATVLGCALLFRTQLPARKCLPRCTDMFLVWGAALLVLNAGYLFEGTGTKLKDYEFCSQALGGPDSTLMSYGNRFRSTAMGKLPLPFPKNYLLGIDYLRYEVEQKKWSFLCGEWRMGSWPHYYIMTTLFKTPESTLLAAGLGLIMSFVRIWRRSLSTEAITMIAILSVPALFAFASVSLQGGFNHHHRYVLQIYPVLFVLAATLGSSQDPNASMPEKKAPQRSLIPCRPLSRLQMLATILAALMVVSSLSVHPHYLSYFNSLSGGPRSGWRLLGSSNVDWGQDLLLVEDWINEHPNCRPLSFELDYCGMNGELFGLPQSKPIELFAGEVLQQSDEATPRYYIINVRKLHNLPNRSGLQYLQRVAPYDTIAFSFNVYRVQPSSTIDQLNAQEN